MTTESRSFSTSDKKTKKRMKHLKSLTKTSGKKSSLTTNHCLKADGGSFFGRVCESLKNIVDSFMQMQRTASAEKRLTMPTIRETGRDVVADAQGDMAQASAAFTQFDLKTCAQRHSTSSMIQATGDEFETVKQGADAQHMISMGQRHFLIFRLDTLGRAMSS